MPHSLPITRLEGIQTRVLWAKRHHFHCGEKHFTDHIPVYFLWVLLKGHLEVKADQGRWKIEAGQVFLGTPCRQRLVAAPEGANWLSLGFSVASRQGIDLLEHKTPQVLRPDAAQRGQLEALLSSLVQVADASEQGPGLMREGLTLAVVGWCLSFGQLNDSALLQTQPLPLWLKQALHRIEQEPSISVEALARQAHFSVAQFRRVFAKHLGTNPRVYLRRRRLELARLWLETSDEPLVLISEKTGWGSASHFSHAFKEDFGVAPLEWRRASRSPL